MYKQVLTLAALCLLASGNLKANPQPAVQTGTLIVFRMWHLAGCARSAPFWINGELVTKLKNGYYYKLQLPVGDYTLTHDFMSASIGFNDPQKVHITAGKTVYFYDQFTAVSFIFEVAEDQAEAQQKVSGLKQQN
jgi:hypothetical protein